MPAERPVLTRDQVMRAESRVGSTHPVLGVIDSQLPRILQLNQEFVPIMNSDKQQQFISERYGFMADALVEAGPFTLEPTDLLVIWSRAMEVFSGYHRYALAGMLSGAYAIQGLEDPEWKRFPRSWLETHQLPEPVRRDRTGLVHVCDRFDQIAESIDELDLYVDGVKGGVSLAFELGRKLYDGDKTVEEELNALIAHSEEFKTPTIEEIHENFGNGFSLMRFIIRETAGDLKS